MKKHPFDGILAIIIFWLIGLMVFSPARAELYMELTQGMNQAIPIAIIPFDGTAVLAPGDQTVDSIINHDLSNSGQFRAAALADANYRLQGQIVDQGNDRYAVTVQLQSVFNAQDAGEPALFKKVFYVQKAELRQLAHTIADLVYEHLTGVRGVFNTKIAYILRQWPANSSPIYALEVADVDGFNPQTLLISPEPLMSPTWSPDGQQIAYVSFEGHQAAIYLQNVRTGQRQLLSRFSGINGAPTFSPDGTKMALVLTKTGNPKIYTMDLATLQLKQLTTGYSIDTEPRWSPDGRSLIFTSDRGGAPQIYRYDFSNEKITRLTYQGNYNARASILPNDRAIIVMHRENSSFGIAKVDLKSGDTQILTEGGMDESPSLAPNGKMVLYATQYQGRGVLAVVSIDGRVKLRLPARAGTVQEPAWSPFAT
jgi:TolB protein